MKDIAPAQQRKILRDNALALYGLPDTSLGEAPRIAAG
jgi:hypothetical protein